MLWNASPFYQSYGYIRIRDKFVDSLRKNILDRHGRRPVPFRKPYQSGHMVLKELNRSGNESFIEMDKKNGLTRMSSYYAYSRLLEKGIVERVTLSMEKMRIRYMGIIIFRITDQYRYESVRPGIHEAPHDLHEQPHKQVWPDRRPDKHERGAHIGAGLWRRRSRSLTLRDQGNIFEETC